MTTLITIHLKKSLLLLACLFSFGAFAVKYTTINSGSWNDPTIWSLDGGSTPCGCVPSTSVSADSVTINHDVTLTSHLTIDNNAQLTVNGSGSLTGTTYRLTVLGNAQADLYGPCTFVRLTNGAASGNNGGTINIHNAIVQLLGPVRLYDGTTTVEGFLYLTTGNFQVYPNATFNTLSGAKLELFGGNITNEGALSICADCCVTTTGNWTNEATGTVSGSGSATTTLGNMNNFGSFSSTITWCSVGFDTGMPSTEDCSTSTTTCGAVMLPVELVAFEGTSMRDHNLLSWVTATEKDCQQFTVTVSTDGNYWTPIGSVDCNGTTTSTSYYQYHDYDYAEGVSYYRLEQMDVDGSIYYSNPISISRAQSATIKCYPNPATMGSTVFITGTDGAGELSVFGPTGTAVYSALINQPTGGSAAIETGSLRSGVYLVEYTNSSGVQRAKFVVQ